MSELDLCLQDPTNFERLFVKQCLGSNSLSDLSSEAILAFIVLAWLGAGSVLILYRQLRGCKSSANIAESMV